MKKTPVKPKKLPRQPKKVQKMPVKMKTTPAKVAGRDLFFHYPFRRAFFLTTFALLIFFYPGNSYYFKLFAAHPQLVTVNDPVSYEYTAHAVPFVRPGFVDPIVSAEGVYVVELDSGTPLFDKNSHRKLLPASTAKVLTALTAVDAFTMEKVLKVKKLTDVGQLMGLVQGEEITLENLLYGALVQSGNDAAYVIADNYPGGVEEFMKAVNQKAANLHMKDSQFQNPAGLDAFDQYSTAFDMSLAGRALLNHPELAKIVSTKSITVSDVNYTYFHPLTNVNKLLGEIPGVAGLKTGQTELAGQNLITYYKKGDKKFMIVLLKSLDRFADTSAIVTWIDASVDFEYPSQ